LIVNKERIVRIKSNHISSERYLDILISRLLFGGFDTRGQNNWPNSGTFDSIWLRLWGYCWSK